MRLERPIDVQNEREVADACEAALGCVFCKTQDKAVLDWLVCRSRKLVLLCDIKCRDKISSTTYSEGIFLSHRKFRHSKLVGAALQIPTGVFYRFTDGIFYVAMTQVVNCEIILAGRTDRGFAHDIEPMLLVPPAILTPLEKLRK